MYRQASEAHFKQAGLTSPGKRPGKRKRRALPAGLEDAAMDPAGSRGTADGAHQDQHPAKRRFQAARDVLAEAREELW